MRKFSALKLVDEAILPVVVVFASKILAVFFISTVFGIVWNINSTNSLYKLYFLSFNSLSDIYLVNSFSDLVMILVAAFGFVWVLFQDSYFGEENLHPVNAAKLHKEGREYLIISQNETYHQAAVWLSLSWLVLFLVLNNAISTTISHFNLGVSLVATAVLTIALGKNQKPF